MSRLFNFKTTLVALNAGFCVAVLAVFLLRADHSTPPPTRKIYSRGLSPDLDRPQEDMRENFANTVSTQTQWMARLRNAGIPSNILAEVVIAENNARWQKRFDEYQDKVARGEADGYEYSAMSLQRDREKEAGLREALGDREFIKWDRPNILKEVNPGKVILTEQEADAIYQIKKDFQSHIQELQESDINGIIGPEDLAEAQNKAHVECAQKINAILGPERHALAQGADDPVSELVRQLSRFNPSDSQIMELANARLQWEKQKTELEIRSYGGNSQSIIYENQKLALDHARDQAYKKMLGAEVFDKLQKQEDPQYGKMKHYAKALGLDDSSIDHVYGSLRSYEKSQQDVQIQARALEAQGQTVDWDAVKGTLKNSFWGDIRHEELYEKLS